HRSGDRRVRTGLKFRNMGRHGAAARAGRLSSRVRRDQIAGFDVARRERSASRTNDQGKPRAAYPTTGISRMPTMRPLSMARKIHPRRVLFSTAQLARDSIPYLTQPFSYGADI